MVSIPAALVDAASRREGDAGVRWLRELPSLIERFLHDWGCGVVGEAWCGEVAIAVPVQRAAEAAVLKISFPHPGNQGEAFALRLLCGRGAVRLLDADEEAFALLLERAGRETLASLASADEAIEVAGHLARRLAIPVPAGSQSLADTTNDWADELDRQVHALPQLVSPQLIARAHATIRELAADATPTMLHGDLHFGNVLSASREPWLVIDPKGSRGTAAFDAFTVIAGRRDDLRYAPDLERAVHDRINRYAKAAGVDTELALACCQARAVSSYLYQYLHQGDWLNLDLLRCATAIAAP